jgi:hypothetical protein
VRRRKKGRSMPKCRTSNFPKLMCYTKGKVVDATSTPRRKTSGKSHVEMK